MAPPPTSHDTGWLPMTLGQLPCPLKSGEGCGNTTVIAGIPLCWSEPRSWSDSRVFLRKKAFADIQGVGSTSLLVEPFWILRRQLLSLGCPAININDRQDDSSGGPMVRCFLCTSDGGSDQSRFKKLCGTMVTDHPTTLFLTFSCLQESLILWQLHSTGLRRIWGAASSRRLSTPTAKSNFTTEVVMIWLAYACGATGGQNQSQRHRHLVQDSQIRWWEAA